MFIIFSPAEIKALLTHASKDPTRPHINGLGVSCSGGVAYAATTDGHRLAVMLGRSDKSEAADNYPAFSENPNFIVPRDPLERALKAAPRKNGWIRIDPAEGKVTVFSTLRGDFQEEGFDPVSFGYKAPADLVFPPVRAVLPARPDPEIQKTEAANLYGVSAVYLAEAAELMSVRASQFGKEKGIRLHLPESDMDPMTMYGYGALVVVMPFML